MGPQDGAGMLGVKGTMPGDQLVTQNAEAVHVDRRCGGPTGHQLGGQVSSRAEELVGPGQLGRGRRPGDPEVGDPGGLVRGGEPVDQDVLRFQVAVDDAGGVDIGQAGRGVSQDGSGGVGRQGAASRSRSRRSRRRSGPFHQLHDDGQRLAFGDQVVDGHDVGVVQANQGGAFPQKPGHRLGVP